jgi:hypothetical protein
LPALQKQYQTDFPPKTPTIWMPSIPGWPDWAIFRLLGDCLLWAVFLITEVVQILGLLYSTVNVLGDFFSN